MGLNDDATGGTWTEGLVRKSDVYDKIVAWIIMMENQIGRKLKVLRSDWGGEFDNDRLKDYCTKKGILWKPLTPYTSQQNGKSGRKNLTLMSAVRSIMAEKKLFRRLWLEIMCAVGHVRNRSPTSTLDYKKTPYEALNGHQPNVSYFRVLGSRAWVLIPGTTSRKKLDERSWQSILVGYDGSNYRVFNPRKGKVTISP